MSRHLCHGSKDVILGNVPGVRCPGISVMEPKDVILGNVPGARCPGISVMEPGPGISVMESDVQASLSWSRKT